MNKQNIILDFENIFNKRDTRIQCELAEFIGWHLGDGCISSTNGRYQYALTGDLIEEFPFYQNIILPIFKKLFSRHVRKKIVLREYKSNGVCGIYLFDKNFVKLLQEKFELIKGKKINTSIPKFIRTQDQKICFLRGLFDTDGSIYFCKSNYKTKNISVFTIFHYKPKIKLATISKELIDQVYQILCDFGFSPMIQKPAKQKDKENIMYGVVLHRKNDTKRWIEEIGFRNPKHLTKVQIWKKFGFCPPYTNLAQRIKILKRKLDPLMFYPEHSKLSLEYIKEKFINKF